MFISNETYKLQVEESQSEGIVVAFDNVVAKVLDQLGSVGDVIFSTVGSDSANWRAACLHILSSTSWVYGSGPPANEYVALHSGIEEQTAVSVLLSVLGCVCLNAFERFLQACAKVKTIAKVGSKLVGAQRLQALSDVSEVPNLTIYSKPLVAAMSQALSCLHKPDAIMLQVISQIEQQSADLYVSIYSYRPN